MDETNRRQYERKNTAVEIKVSGGGLEKQVAGLAVNMSLNGIFVEMLEPLPKRFSQVDIELLLEQNNPIHCRGIVSRYGSSPNGRLGVAIQLVLSENQMKQLEGYLEKADELTLPF